MIAHDVAAIRGARSRVSGVICLYLHHRLFSHADENASGSGHICLADVVTSDSEAESTALRPRNSSC